MIHVRDHFNGGQTL